MPPAALENRSQESVNTDERQAEKRRLRVALAAARDGIAGGTRTEAAARIVAHLRGWSVWQQARGVAAFVPIRSEPDIHPLLEACWSSGRPLWLPRVDGKAALSFRRIDDPVALVPGVFGLREPPVSAPVAPLTREAGIDLVIVPGLGFDRAGARLGYGAGHYDRALKAAAEAGTRARTCAVCFDRQLEPVEGPIPMGPHDVHLDAVATEAGIHVVGSAGL